MPRTTNKKRGERKVNTNKKYDASQESEDIVEFLSVPITYNEVNGVDEVPEEDVNTDDEDISTDDEHVEMMVKDLEPEVFEMYIEASPKPHIKKVFDYKIVSPYLLTAFINGYLDTNKCSLLKDRKSRRKLFYYYN